MSPQRARAGAARERAGGGGGDGGLLRRTRDREGDPSTSGLCGVKKRSWTLEILSEISETVCGDAEGVGCATREVYFILYRPACTRRFVGKMTGVVRESAAYLRQLRRMYRCAESSVCRPDGRWPRRSRPRYITTNPYPVLQLGCKAHQHA